MSKPYTIRVYRMAGPGFWARIYFKDGNWETVCSGVIYGFDTREEAREEAKYKADAILEARAKK